MPQFVGDSPLFPNKFGLPHRNFWKTECPYSFYRAYSGGTAQGCTAVPPDLAVEVVSPTDMFDRVEEKAFAYLEAGTRMVWVIAPRSKVVMVYRSETDLKLLTCNDTLSGEDVVKGFSCEVARLFESPK